MPAHGDDTPPAPRQDWEACHRQAWTVRSAHVDVHALLTP